MSKQGSSTVLKRFVAIGMVFGVLSLIVVPNYMTMPPISVSMSHTA